MTETTFTRGWSPWKSEFATKASSPSGVTEIVVGNISTGALPTSVSPSAAIFQSEPYGVPCAMVTYQNLPSGDTVTLWGPSTSAGMIPTGTTFAVLRAVPSHSSWDTMSPDSLATRIR